MSSRRKDGGVPRRKHGNCNKPLRQAKKDADGRHDKIGDFSQKAGPSSRDGGGGSGSDRPPPGLKGKALGLWYRDRQVKRNVQSEDKMIPEVKLPREKFEEIEELLFDVGPAGKIEESNLMIDGDFKNDYFDKIRGTFEENMMKQLAVENMEPNIVMDQEMKARLERKLESSSSYNEMLAFRKKLPCYKKKNELLKVIAEHQLVVISGETGCGKTTQVAQYVLDEAILGGRGSQCSIVCTQPRRISAISVAERVATERDEPLGNTVGYQIRLEKVLPKQKRGSVMFVTTGILLQWIQSNPTLNGISHLFLDEVHERDILCDFVITCLKQIILKRPNLKVILMSATLNAERFSSYFGGAPCIHIPGFTFPVEEVYLDQVLEVTKFRFQEKPGAQGYRGRQSGKNMDFEHVIVPHIRSLEGSGHISRQVATQLKNPESEKLNVDLVEALIHHICLYEGEGAILVFVPGLSDIQKINKQLLSRNFFHNSRFIIIPLHSTLPTMNQRQIFNRPPRGVRKIIIATNIAETSITIDDVVFVIDSGFIKMKNFNMELNVSTLDSQWVSLANARQRRGRAGRVEAGKCYKLYTTARENLFEQFPLPEMQRTRLEEVVLQVKMLQLGKVAPFLETVLDPPDKQAVAISLQMLRTLNALDAEEGLTPLGFHLAKLPLDPQTGKMILMAAIFGCVDPILSIAAALAFKDPFMTPLGKEPAVRRIKEDLARGEKSDHYILCAAIKEWEVACQNQDGRNFAFDHFLSGNTLSLLRDMKGQFARHLHEMNFLRTANPKDENGNVNSRNVELVKAIVCSGLYPNVAMVKAIKKNGLNPVVLLRTAQHIRVELHPRSICSKVPWFESPFVVYHMMMKSSAIYIHDATMVSPWALLFFGERLDIVEFDKNQGIRVDDLIKFKCFRKTAMLISKLRSQLDWILASAVSNPEVVDWGQRNKKSAVLKAIVQLITAENEEMMLLMDELD